jgi:hypothetical protein
MLLSGQAKGHLHLVAYFTELSPTYDSWLLFIPFLVFTCQTIVTVRALIAEPTMPQAPSQLYRTVTPIPPHHADYAKSRRRDRSTYAASLRQDRRTTPTMPHAPRRCCIVTAAPASSSFAARAARGGVRTAGGALAAARGHGRQSR